MSSSNKSKTPHSFLEEEKEFKGAYSKEVFQVLYWAYLPYFKRSILWILLGWIGRVFLMSNTRIMGLWIDSLYQLEKIPALFRSWTSQDYFKALLVCSVVGYFLTLCFRLAFSRLSVKAISSIYDEVTLRVSRFPMSFFDRTPVGRVVTRFSSDYGNMFRMFGGPLSEFLGIIFDLLAVFAILAQAHILGIAFYIALLLLNLFVYSLNKKRIRSARRDQSRRRSPSVAHFAETVQGAAVIRVFGKTPSFLARFEFLDSDFIKAKLKSTQVQVLYAAQMMCSTYGVAFLSGTLGLWLLSRSLISAGELSAIMILLNLAGGSFQMFFDWMAQIEEAFVGVERMNEYLRLPLEAEAKVPATSRFPTHHLKESLTIEDSRIAFMSDSNSASLKISDLHFRYSQNLPWVLKGIELDVKAGERIGIIGRTGAGKTSLFQALQFNYPVEKGTILWSDKKLSIHDTRSLFAVIPQDPMLLNATVRENLILGLSSVDGVKIPTDKILLDCLDSVGLNHWLAGQSNPLNVMIEEKGRNLSAGERQLFVMARMSLMKRKVVLMDEATSSIDPQTEEKLVQAMKVIFDKRTQLIIAHRLSTIEHCHRIAWIQNGQIEMFDTPERVLKKFKS